MIDDKIKSIGDLFSDEDMPFRMPVIAKELMIFKEISNGKLIEYEDREQMTNLQKKGLKLLLGTTIIVFASNRALTIIQTKRFNFMNFHIIKRLLMRGTILTGCFYTCFYLPLLKELILCSDGLNKKYLPRYKQYIKSRNPLHMNPKLWKDPELTEEEYNHFENLKNNVRKD